MNLLNRYLICAASLLACAGMSAQNLNPQVQVTNDYEARMGEAAKKGVALEVPDSLSEFRTSVDYKVFRTEYKGSYEFHPYRISVAPEVRDNGASRAYLRAGAGYAFHPVLQGVYAVKPKGLLRGSLFQDFHGYAGQYISAVDARSFNGRDLSETAGADFRLNNVKYDLSGSLAYKGLFTKDSEWTSNSNGVVLDGHILSNNESPVSYDINAGASYTDDHLIGATKGHIRETALHASGSFMPRLMLPVDVLIDFGFEGAFYASKAYDPMLCYNIAPKVVYEYDFLRLQGGMVLHAGSDGLGVAPDLRVSARLMRGDMEAAAYLTGGRKANTYGSFKNEDHWFNPTYTADLATTVVRYDAGLSLSGVAFRYLQYSVKGGYASIADAPAGILTANAIDPALLDCGIMYVNYRNWYADALLAWKTERLDVDFRLGWRNTDAADGAAWLDLPHIRCGGKALYNWNGRVAAGVRFEASGERRSAVNPVDGWVDLGFCGEYYLLNGISFWAQAGNMLNHCIALSPTHCAEGPFFTAGICLKLR